jgi:hypothetical protein
MSTASTIQQYYNAFYGRPADPSGLAFWVAGVNNSGDLIGAALKVFGSPSTPEFALRYPAGTSVSTFLDTAYGNMFNRTPDADGKRFWEAAFTNWVGGGKSEGEARALILQNFVDSANAQVGTADKLTITNKLTVAEMMTASVKAYGTETAYMSKLDKAQKLLAGVDAGQPSVDAALAKIKAGGIYEAGDPPAKPTVIITTFDRLNGTGLSNETAEILKFDSAAVAPFSYITGSDFKSLRGLTIGKFSVDSDRIDLSAFHLGGTDGGRISSVAAFPWGMTGANSFDGSIPTAYRTYNNFFQTTIAVVERGAGTPIVDTQLFVDINKNGDLDPEIDLWIELAGVPKSAIGDSIFIL